MERKQTQQAATLPKVVEDCHALLLWLIPHLDKLPRQRRFTIGERIETELLDVLAACVSATYSRNKQSALHTASQRLAVVQHLWRLAYELHNVAPKSYRFGSQQLLSIGAQIGGWLKSSL